MAEKGRFITFEGGEGAGKSTQLALLAAFLRDRGLPVVTTREPGGSQGAEEIRRLLVEGGAGRWDGITEALLHSAARRDHLRRVVWPGLESGNWVLSDRFADSTLAYQGYGHGLPAETIRALQTLTCGNFTPDLTVILDLPVAEGLARAAARGGAENRYEQMGHAFHDRLRQGFLEIAAAEAGRCVIIPATGDVAAVQGRVREAVRERLLG
jgi:dTMP kinase